MQKQVSCKWIDTTSNKWREGFAHQTRRYRVMRDDTLTKAGVDRIDVPTDGDYVDALMRFFQRRVKRL